MDSTNKKLDSTKRKLDSRDNHQKWTLEMNIFEKIEYFSKKDTERFGRFKKKQYLCTRLSEMVTKTLQGVLTERLGNGLQNRVERFDSARHLAKKEILF